MANTSVRVYCRFRPYSADEKKAPHTTFPVRIIDEQTVNIAGNSTLGNSHQFTFDHIFPSETTQEQVYMKMAQGLINDILNGINCTIFAYGVSGCLEPRTLVKLFHSIGSEREIVQADGSIVCEAQNIILGDKLVGDDGKPRTVEQLFSGEDMMYKIYQWPETMKGWNGKIPSLNERVTAKASSYTVNSNHVLTLFYPNVGLFDIPLKDYLAQPDEWKNVAKGVIYRGNATDETSPYSLQNIVVVKLGKGKYNGWAINGNHRFQLADGTITHNSGKTYTMTGYSHLVDNKEALFKQNVKLWEHEEDMGLVARLLKDLFAKLEIMKEKSIVQISYVEIYLEHIRDLLNPTNTNLKIREEPDGQIWIEDVVSKQASSFEQVLSIMRKGEQNRTIASTNLNAQSSRSHSVLMVNLLMADPSTGVQKFSKMIFVDLAGSEKVEKSGASGLVLKQAQSTNKSLLCLGRVIKQLVEKDEYISYRDSKLTRILSDSLGGSSKTCLVVTCRPSSLQLEETITTLRFGRLTSRIVNNLKINAKGRLEYKDLYEKALLTIEEQKLLIDRLKKGTIRMKTMGVDVSALTDAFTPQEEVQRVSDIVTIEKVRAENLELANILADTKGDVEHYQEISYNQGHELEESAVIISAQAQEISQLQLELQTLHEARERRNSIQENAPIQVSHTSHVSEHVSASSVEKNDQTHLLQKELRDLRAQLDVETSRATSLQDRLKQTLRLLQEERNK